MKIKPKIFKFILNAIIFIAILTILCLSIYYCSPFSIISSYKQINKSYEIMTSRLSYFALDSEGNLKLKDGKPYKSENIYQFKRIINPEKTAIIIMDPWEINKYYKKIIKLRIIPLIKETITHGHPIIIFTNNSLDKASPEISPKIKEITKKNNITILYHQDFNDDKFAKYLHSHGIESLIYAGFASNMCLIGRQTGMIEMLNKGFKIFFVPKASAAIEYHESWENKSIHKAITQIISQWIAEIIDYDEFIRVMDLHPVSLTSNNQPLH